jgi:hypothetical protein
MEYYSVFDFMIHVQILKRKSQALAVEAMLTMIVSMAWTKTEMTKTKKCIQQSNSWTATIL